MICWTMWMVVESSKFVWSQQITISIIITIITITILVVNDQSFGSHSEFPTAVGPVHRDLTGQALLCLPANLVEM